MSRSNLLAAAAIIGLSTLQAAAQNYGTESRNIHQLGQVPLGLMVRADAAAWLVDVRVDQREDYPYVYAAEQSGWALIDVSDPNAPRVSSVTPMPFAPNRGDGVSSIDYLEVDGQSVVVVGSDNALSVFEMSSDGQVTEVSSVEGAFGNIFAYRHSSGRPLLIATSGGSAELYDARDLLEGEASAVGEIATPDQPDSTAGFESVFAAFHADTDTDRFYGAGAGGYHVFDIANVDSLVYITSASPAAGRRGLAGRPSPDGRYLVTTEAYRTAPVRIFDLEPAMEAHSGVVQTSVGTWANDRRSFHMDHETRWPYVFVASAEQGLQVFNARDVTDPHTVASFATSRRSEGTVSERPKDVGGAIAVDIRNRDGLIVVGDQQTGVWFLHLNGFDRWDGRR